MFLHHKSVLPGLIQCDLFLISSLLLVTIFAYRKPEFGLSANIRDYLFWLAQRSSPVVKLFQIVVAISINMHNNVSCETRAIFVY